MSNKLTNSLANLGGMNTFWTDQFKSAGNAFTQTFGDGSWNNPSKSEFWRGTESPNVTEMFQLPTKFSRVPGADSFSNPTNFPQFGQPAGNNQPMQMESNPYGIEHLLGVPQSVPQNVPVAPASVTPQVQPVVRPSQPLPDTNPMADTTWGQPVSNTPSVAYSNLVPNDISSNTGMFMPYDGNSTVDSGSIGSDSSFMDMFGLGDMSSKDIYSGIGSAAQLGMAAYGMFRGFDQADTRLAQGQQALDLSRDEYEENLRRRQSITAQNRGA